MVNLTKEQILESMISVYECFDKIIKNPNTSMRNIIERYYFYHYHEGDVTKLYDKIYADFCIYAEIVRVRIFTYFKDHFLEIIDENDLNLTDIKNRIFVNRSDIAQYSDKNVIKNIRNALAHSDGMKEEFKIYLNSNGCDLEIDFTQSNRRFHVVINESDFEAMILKISALSKFKYCSCVDKTTMKIKRIYLDKNTDYARLLNDLKIQVTKADYDECTLRLIEYLNSNQIPYAFREYDLTPEQETIINDFVQMCAVSSPNSYIDNQYKYFTLLSNIIPSAAEKTESMIDHLCIVLNILRDSKCTYRDFVKQSHNGLNGKPSTSSISKSAYDNTDSNNQRYISNYLDSLSGESIKNEILMEIFEFYFSSYCAESNITICNQNIEVNKLRNALVHGRWFIDKNSNLVYFDAVNGRLNDYNFHLKGVLPLNDLYNYCRNNITLTERNKIKTKK